MTSARGDSSWILKRPTTLLPEFQQQVRDTSKPATHTATTAPPSPNPDGPTTENQLLACGSKKIRSSSSKHAAAQKVDEISRELDPLLHTVSAPPGGTENRRAYTTSRRTTASSSSPWYMWTTSYSPGTPRSTAWKSKRDSSPSTK